MRCNWLNLNKIIYKQNLKIKSNYAYNFTIGKKRQKGAR